MCARPRWGAGKTAHRFSFANGAGANIICTHEKQSRKIKSACNRIATRVLLWVADCAVAGGAGCAGRGAFSHNPALDGTVGFCNIGRNVGGVMVNGVARLRMCVRPLPWRPFAPHPENNIGRDNGGVRVQCNFAHVRALSMAIGVCDIHK